MSRTRDTSPSVGSQSPDPIDGRPERWYFAVSPMRSYQRSHLRALEDESIHILRELAAERERPVLLFSGGKDSAVMLRLAEKAFWRPCTSWE